MQVLPGTPVVRPTEPADLARLEALVARCSDATLYRRFHGAGRRPIGRELERIATSTASHRSWVAVTHDGAARGTATLAWGRSGTVEAAFLVEDEWFRRGIGRSLYAALAAGAARAGVPAVVASLQADNERAIRFLRSVSSDVRPNYVGGAVLEVVIPVRGAVRTAAPQSVGSRTAEAA